MVRRTVQDRVLLYLWDHPVEPDAVDVPGALTQDGIAQEAGFPVRHFSILVGPLVRRGLVRERIAHVPNSRQRRKVYALTALGRTSAADVREALMSEVVRVQKGDELREMRVSDLLGEARGLSLLRLVRQVAHTGLVDPTLLSAPQPAVAMVEGAPRLDRFVGRNEELRAVTKESAHERVFVVRGVPGIGKSTFAARACEMLRESRNLFWHRVRPWDTFASMLAHLGEFLAEAGRPGLRATLMRGEMQRAGDVLRKDLAGVRSFLVFDDAHEGGAEVASFFRLLKESLPPEPDARILLLTRQTLPFYDRRDVRIDGLVEEIQLEGLKREEVDALLAGAPDADEIRIHSDRMGGHPLFLRLVRATMHSPPQVDAALADFRRFLEEQVYSALSSASRSVMRLACLYRVPVSREALIEDLGFPHDVILELVDGGLLRRVGTGDYEVHDSVREFFDGLLTTSERRDLGRIAVKQLERRAILAFEAGSFLACVDFASSALSLAESDAERGRLWERLGEAHARLGDLPASTEAYREALRVAERPEEAAGIHRKMAEQFLNKLDLGNAARAIEAGFHALGTREGPERGWLELMQALLCEEQGSLDTAHEHLVAALRILEATDDRSGHGLALVELGKYEMATDGASSAEGHLLEALRIARTARDPWLLEYALRILAWVASAGRGDVARAMALYAEIDELASATGNPMIRTKSLHSRGFFDLLARADFEAAERKFAEWSDFASRRYDTGGVLAAQEATGVVRFFQGRYDEACAIFERTLDAHRRLGHTADAVDVIGYLAESCLLAGDVPALRRLVAQSREPDLKAWTQLEPCTILTYRGILALVDGDRETARGLIEEAARLVKMPVAPHYYLLASVVLRALGDETAGEEQRRMAGEVARSRARGAFLMTMEARERRMGDVIQDALSKG